MVGPVCPKLFVSTRMASSFEQNNIGIGNKQAEHWAQTPSMARIWSVFSSYKTMFRITLSCKTGLVCNNHVLLQVE